MAKKEKANEVAQRVQKVLDENSDLNFKITIKEPIQEPTGLSVPNKKNGLNASVNKNINTSTDPFKSMSVRELRNYTLKYYNENIRGKSVEIEKHLKEVVFTNTAGKKIAKGEAMYSEKATIIEYLEELIKKSSYNNWGQRKSTDNSEVLGYLNFKSKITIDNTKRHVRISLIVYKNRKSELKNVEVGKIKKSGKHNAELQCSTLQDDVCKPLSNHKDNKKHTKKPILKEKRNGNTLNTLVPVHSVAYKMQKNHDRIREYYEISDPELAKYLGKIEKKTKESVAITIAGEQGSSKSRLAFQLIKAFGSYKIGYASIEKHPDSKLYDEKLSINKFFMNAVTKAVSNIKPKTVEVTRDNPHHIQAIETLEIEKNGLLQKISELEKAKPKGLVLNFSEEWEKYIWGVLEISKKDGYAQTYEELFIKMFQIMHQRKELVLDQADYDYLKTLENVN